MVYVGKKYSGLRLLENKRMQCSTQFVMLEYNRCTVPYYGTIFVNVGNIVLLVIETEVIQL